MKSALRNSKNDAVFARLAGHQIVERGELDVAYRGEPLERARPPNVIDELVFGDEHDLNIEHRCQRREVARSEQGRQRHRNQLFGVNRAPQGDDQASLILHPIELTRLGSLKTTVSGWIAAAREPSGDG
jgi:hypothetical protein